MVKDTPFYLLGPDSSTIPPVSFHRRFTIPALYCTSIRGWRYFSPFPGGKRLMNPAAGEVFWFSRSIERGNPSVSSLWITRSIVSWSCHLPMVSHLEKVDKLADRRVRSHDWTGRRAKNPSWSRRWVVFFSANVPSKFNEILLSEQSHKKEAMTLTRALSTGYWKCCYCWYNRILSICCLVTTLILLLFWWIKCILNCCTLSYVQSSL